MAKLTDEIAKLKKIGKESIYEKTLISYETIDLILKKETSQIQNVKLNGFVTIIKRELNIDLSDLLTIKEEIKTHKEQTIEQETNKEIPPKSSSFIFYLSFVLLIGIFAIYLNLSSVDEKTKVDDEIMPSMETTPPIIGDTQTEQEEYQEGYQEEEQEEEQEEIEQKPIKRYITGQKIQKEVREALKTATPIYKITKKKTPVQTFKDMIIKPQGNSQLWVGVIDLDKNKKYYKTIKNQ